MILEPLSSLVLQRSLATQPSTSSSTDTLRTLYGHRYFVNELDFVNELIGHSGCVNTVCWSHSGRLLASGSDDTFINIHTYRPNSFGERFTLSTSIATGHTQNIFSVKFLPYSQDRSIVSAAGDSQVRIFDIEYDSRLTRDSHNFPRRYSTADAHVKVFRSHSDRVKRIVTEFSPYTFLTCSEDGDVRHWDIRSPESAYPTSFSRTSTRKAPPPLISYRRFNISLNTISCSQFQPQYIALGGDHLHCFLHDRRMSGRDLTIERGQPDLKPSEISSDSMSAATRCVRRFAPDGRRKMRKGTDDYISACKISDYNPNRLIVSWSGDHIYGFDITRSPDALDDPTTLKSNVEDGNNTRCKVGTAASPNKSKKSDSQEALSSRLEASGSQSNPRAGNTENSGTSNIEINPTSGGNDSMGVPVGDVVEDEPGQSLIRINDTADRDESRARMREFLFGRSIASSPAIRIGNLRSESAPPATTTLSSLDSMSEGSVNSEGQLLFTLSEIGDDAITIHSDTFTGSNRSHDGLNETIESVEINFDDYGDDMDFEDEYEDIDGNDDDGNLVVNSEEDYDDLDYDSYISMNATRSFFFRTGIFPESLDKSDAHLDSPCISHSQVYQGHCNIKTVKDVNFFGMMDEYVVSGSDCGHVFLWERDSGKLIQILEGDSDVVNVVQGHPFEPMLAVSGIDSTIKIFSADYLARHEARMGYGIKMIERNDFGSSSYGTRTHGTSNHEAVSPSLMAESTTIVSSTTTAGVNKSISSKDDRLYPPVLMDDMDEKVKYHDRTGLPSKRCMEDAEAIMNHNRTARLQYRRNISLSLATASPISLDGEQPNFLTRGMMALLGESFGNTLDQVSSDDDNDGDGDDETNSRAASSSSNEESRETL